MPDEPKPSIFISHATEDGTIAHAIQDAVQALFGDTVAMRYSTSKELDTGIKPGEDWFRWIGQQVREVKVALILLTPRMVQTARVLWESGAVAGGRIVHVILGNYATRKYPKVITSLGRACPLCPPLHPDLRLLAQGGRGVLREPNQATARAWCILLDHSTPSSPTTALSLRRTRT